MARNNIPLTFSVCFVILLYTKIQKGRYNMKDQIQIILDTNNLNGESQTALQMLIFDLYTLKQCVECNNSKDYLERCVISTLQRLDIQVGFTEQKAV